MLPATVFGLAVLAGAFIALGAIFFSDVVAGGGALPYGVVRLPAGLTFSLRLILVVVAAFVAAGFEHSVANMYFIPFGLS